MDPQATEGIFAAARTGIEMTAAQSSIARRNVEFYGNAPSGHTDMVSRDGTAQGIGGARVRASRGRQVYGERPGSREVLSESRSEEHTSELQSRSDLVCRLLLEKKKKKH